MSRLIQKLLTGTKANSNIVTVMPMPNSIRSSTLNIPNINLPLLVFAGIK